MEEVKKFLSSKTCKLVITGVVILLVVYFSMVVYQKIIYNGLSKNQIIKAVAQAYAQERIAHIMKTDSNILTGKYPVEDIMVWYDENQPPNIDIEALKGHLTRLGVDWVKYPKILNIKPKVDSTAFLTMHI